MFLYTESFFLALVQQVLAGMSSLFGRAVLAKKNYSYSPSENIRFNFLELSLHALPD